MADYICGKAHHFFSVGIYFRYTEFFYVFDPDFLLLFKLYPFSRGVNCIRGQTYLASPLLGEIGPETQLALRIRCATGQPGSFCFT